MKSLLTESDYKKLLKFHLFINADYERFIPNVLQHLADNFDFPVTAYTIFNKDSNNETYVENVYSDSIHTESLLNYKNNHYKSDLFFQRISYKQVSVLRKNLYTIDDIAKREEFFGTVYGRSLANQNIYSQAVIRGALSKTVPFHVLSFFKTSEDGDFTPYELELLENISQIFCKSVVLYKNYIDQKSYQFYLTSLCNDQNTGLAVLDTHLKVIYSNQLILEFISETYGIIKYNNVSTVVGEIINKAKEYHGIQTDKLTSEVIFTEGNYELSFKPHYYRSGEFVKRFLFITTKKQQVTSSPYEFNLEIFSQYNFSAREAEIINLLAHGYNNNEIADALFISVSTVKFHVRNIFNKLGVTNRTAAIAKILKT